MTATLQPKPWDLSHVLDLASSLSFGDAPSEQPASHADPKGPETVANEHKEDAKNIETKDFANQPHTLGDFSKIFEFLGTPNSLPASAVATLPPQSLASPETIFDTRHDYASDGATYSKASSRVTFKAAEELVEDTVSDSSYVPDTPTLTKTQRKKKNRKERKAKEAALAAERQVKKTDTYVSESEADILARKAPAKTASAHALNASHNNNKACSSRDGNVTGKATGAKEPDTLLEAARVAAAKLDSAKRADKQASAAAREGGAQHTNSFAQHHSPNHQQQNTVLPSKTNGVPKDAAQSTRPLQQWPPYTPSKNGAAQFVPATVRPHQSAPKPTLKHPHSTTQYQNAAPRNAASVIQPMLVRSGEDRHWALLMKLIGDFFEDRKYLISPMNLTTHNNNPKGIHLFVDASNIFIGFNDQLKRSRGISPLTHIPPVNMSFDALALLMERRRPVCKRVLVGSTPHLPAFDKAKAVGYECSILEKVYKARELTERQIYFKELDQAKLRKRAKAPPANNVASVNGGYGSGSGSGSETNTPQYAPPAMIEQGVDEVLHLKILESIVDTESPSTIVLATGDAAQAEYSQGFMAMAERALKKGWTLELVSWSTNISSMYTRKEWRETWGDRFKIIKLDEYAEELLDM